MIKPAGELLAGTIFYTIRCNIDGHIERFDANMDIEGRTTRFSRLIRDLREREGEGMHIVYRLHRTFAVATEIKYENVIITFYTDMILFTKL